MAAVLEIENLRVDYGNLTAVDDLTLTLGAGEIFGLAGPNGAGKTSTIRVLATLLEPTYGEVRVCGHDLFDSPAAAHAELGYMPDLAPVVPDLKVWEFLDLFAQSYGLRGAEKARRVDECLALVRLEDKRNEYGRALSRGMTQRVVLAKTLLHAPQLLLLDEPASGMDPIARRDLRRVLRDVAATGASVVVSSHILSELAEMCTSVGIMHQGRLLRSGPIAAVLATLGAERVSIEMAVVERHEHAAVLLDGHASVSELSVRGKQLKFAFEGDAEARAKLLATLVAEGIGIEAFSPTKIGIEQLLMSLVEDSDK